MSTRSEGTFEVLGFTPAAVEPAVEVTTAMDLGVATMEKRYTGEVDGTSATWFSGGQAPGGAGTYVALEAFAGTLDERAGSFVFVHAASTHGQDRYGELFAIAEGSGTGELAGITGGGGMSVDDDGTHRIWFDWDVPRGRDRSGAVTCCFGWAPARRRSGGCWYDHLDRRLGRLPAGSTTLGWAWPGKAAEALRPGDVESPGPSASGSYLADEGARVDRDDLPGTGSATCAATAHVEA